MHKANLDLSGHWLCQKPGGEKKLLHWAREPRVFVNEVFGVEPEDYQCDMTQLVSIDNDMDRGAMKSAHGVGKSAGHAFAGWQFLITRPMSRIVATAPTRAQLTDALWPEYAKWHAVMDQRLPEIAAMFDISETHIRCKARPKGWFAVARTSNRPQNLQGFHGKHVLVQVDEASAVPEDVFETLEGILSNADFEDDEILLMLTGNPNFTSGEFHNAFHKNRDMYHRITVSGDPETKFTKTCGNTYISRRVTKTYRDRMAKKYGKDSAVYDVRVRGMFPRHDDWAVVPLEYAERAAHVALPTFDRYVHPYVLACDIARAGGSKSTIGYFRGGHMVKLDWWPKTKGTEIEDRIVEAFQGLIEAGEQVAAIVIDEPGVGGPIIDQLRRRYVEFQGAKIYLPIVSYHGGTRLDPDVDGQDDCRMFANRRARDWWNVRRLMERGKMSIPFNQELIDELASVHYDYNEQEKIKVESKRDMRKRLGDDASPDLADTVVMGMAPRYRLATEGAESILDGDWGAYHDRATGEETQEDMEGLW